MSAIAIRGLRKSFPQPGGPGNSLPALNGVDLDVGDGELLALIGPSGCGKTTLLRILAGLENPDAGSVSFDGRDQRGIPPERRNVAMVFQNLALFPHMTARRNLAFGLELRRAPAAEIEARIAEVAGLLGIAGCLSRRPPELSAGQRQRIAFGRALVRRPNVLLLDEPFASLDAPLRRELRRELLRVHRDLKLTVILVTHDQAEALALGRRVAVMNAGVIGQVAAPDVLIARPASPFVAAFFDSRPL